MSLASCGDEDFDVRGAIDSLTGEEVTEEVWNAALDLESEIYNNFAIDVVETDIDNKHGTEVMTHHCVHVNRLSYMWVIEDYSAVAEEYSHYYEDDETYSEKIGDKKCKREFYYDSSTDDYFQKIKGEWCVPTYSGWQDGKGDYGLGYLNSTTFTISHFGNFSDYTYSAEKRGYVKTISENGDESSVVVKFADGKLKSLQYNFTVNEYGIIGEKLYYLTYGGQSVERPEVG